MASTATMAPMMRERRVRVLVAGFSGVTVESMLFLVCSAIG
jgi:hypothetical protein